MSYFSQEFFDPLYKKFVYHRKKFGFSQKKVVYPSEKSKLNPLEKDKVTPRIKKKFIVVSEKGSLSYGAVLRIQ